MSWLTLTIAAILLLNLVATVIVLRTDLCTVRQRRMQLWLLWAVPVVGAITCLVFVYSQTAPEPVPSKLEPMEESLGGFAGDAPAPGLCESSSDSDACSGGDGAGGSGD